MKEDSAVPQESAGTQVILLSPAQRQELMAALRVATEVRRLALLTDLEYERVRRVQAKRLKLRVGKLDEQVARVRARNRVMKRSGTLLEDIRAVFDAEGVERLRARDLIERLADLPDRPWATCGWGGGPISRHQLAKLLKPIGIVSHVFRDGATTYRGYGQSDFANLPAKNA